MMYDYRLAVLGFPLQIKASSLAVARRRALKRYITALGLSNKHLPVIPTITLLSTNDPRVSDAELRAAVDDEITPVKTGDVVYLKPRLAE